MKKIIFTLSALLLFFQKLLLADVGLIPLKDSKIKNSEYSSILCFRISEHYKSNISNRKGPSDIERSYLLRYFDGAELSHVVIKYHGHAEEKRTDFDEIVYLAAKPGNYDLLDFFDRGQASSGGTYSYRSPDKSYPINTVIELKAGKAYYAGEVKINFDEKFKSTYSLFRLNIINDSLTHDFKTKYPNVYSEFMNDFVPAAFYFPKPLQPTKVIFSSQFRENEGIWKVANDSLHIASYENGQYCIEGKSDQNRGAEIIELPEKLGNTFDIELRCKWKTGVNDYSYGLIIPNSQLFSSKRFEGELKAYGYSFNIDAKGYASIGFEGYSYEKNIFKPEKNRIGIIDWKIIPNIKTNGSGQNTIRVQVIDKVISYYVNDMFVTRNSPNYFPGLESFVNFLYPESKLLGIFSYSKQKIEFDEIKVSKF